jgi:hypothetical protein
MRSCLKRGKLSRRIRQGTDMGHWFQAFPRAMRYRLPDRRMYYAAFFITAFFFISGCSSPEDAAETFLIKCFAGDFEGARLAASPEVVQAFRESIDSAGGIAPIKEKVEISELESLFDEYLDVVVERRMKSYAVVIVRPDWTSLEPDVSRVMSCSQDGFRLLVVKEHGRWIVGGVLQSGSPEVGDDEEGDGIIDDGEEMPD